MTSANIGKGAPQEKKKSLCIIQNTLYTAESTLVTKQCSTTSHAAQNQDTPKRQEGSRTRLQIKKKHSLESISQQYNTIRDTQTVTVSLESSRGNEFQPNPHHNKQLLICSLFSHT